MNLLGSLVHGSGSRTSLSGWLNDYSSIDNLAKTELSIAQSFSRSGRSASCASWDPSSSASGMQLATIAPRTTPAGRPPEARDRCGHSSRRRELFTSTYLTLSSVCCCVGIPNQTAPVVRPSVALPVAAHPESPSLRGRDQSNRWGKDRRSGPNGRPAVRYGLVWSPQCVRRRRRYATALLRMHRWSSRRGCPRPGACSSVCVSMGGSGEERTLWRPGLVCRQL